MNLLITIPNWNELLWYHYLAIGGGVLVVLALILWLTPVSRLKVPAIVTGIVGGLAVGAALGAVAVMAMIALGYQMDKEYAYEGDQVQVGAPVDGKGKGGPGGGKKGGFGGKKGGPGAGQKGGFGPAAGSGVSRGPSSKAQLATLVTKLDLLTHKPLAVTLDGEQKKKVRDALQKLDEEKDLSDEKAQEKIGDLQKILTDDQKKTLEAAGFRWPGQGGGGPGGGQTPPNPFSEGENNQHLKSLLGDAK